MISPTSPLHLPYISPTSRLYLAYVSPISRPHLAGERGQLGHGDLENHKTPTPLLGLQGEEIGCVGAGEAHSLASSRDGRKVWAWGAGHYGQLGVGGLEPRLSPAPIEELEMKSITQVAAGANHSGAVSEEGQVYMWGNGANSRLSP